MFHRSNGKIDPERAPPPCRNFSRVASLAFHFHLICHKPLYILDPISIIALPCQSVSPSLLSLNFVPMGLVGLVSPVSLVYLLGMVSLLGLVGLVGMGCQVGLILGTF